MTDIPARLDDKLHALRACRDAIEWGNGQDPSEAWHACPHADWLLWLLVHLGMRAALRRALAAILTEQALPHAGSCEPQVRRVVELLGQSNLSKGKLIAAACAADAANAAADAAADAATYAANAADAAASAAGASQPNIIRGVVSWSEVQRAARRKGLM